MDRHSDRQVEGPGTELRCDVPRRSRIGSMVKSVILNQLIKKNLSIAGDRGDRALKTSRVKIILHEIVRTQPVGERKHLHIFDGT
jgi:hypothetical protein